MHSNLIVAVALSTAAGLSTALGGLAVVLLPGAKSASGEHRLARWQGTTAGFMVGLSFFDLLPEVYRARNQLPLPSSVLCFVLGALVFALLERLVPEPFTETEASLAAPDGIGIRSYSSAETPSARRGPSCAPSLKAGFNAERHRQGTRAVALRSALLTTLSLALHNLPEGMAVAASALSGGLRLGLPLAIGIALHNAPEGCAIAAPVYAATNSRIQAVTWALIAGLVEPLGVFFLIWFRLNRRALTGLLAGVAGIMTMLSCTELLPQALRMNEQRPGVVFSEFAFGMLLMLGLLSVVRWSFGVEL
jgi:ZIP family zinc transporter